MDILAGAPLPLAFDVPVDVTCPAIGGLNGLVTKACLHGELLCVCTLAIQPKRGCEAVEHGPVPDHEAMGFDSQLRPPFLNGICSKNAGSGGVLNLRQAHGPVAINSLLALRAGLATHSQ